MLKLCGFRISNYHNKVRLALLEKGVPHEEDPGCMPSQKDDWVGRSSMGKVPILEVDGTTLSESEVICEYLEDAFPQKPLLPKDPKGRARVRGLAQIVAADSHPLIVPRVREYLEHELKVDEDTRNKWCQNWHRAALTALETNLKDKATGKYAHGDQITVAALPARRRAPLSSRWISGRSRPSRGSSTPPCRTTRSHGRIRSSSPARRRRCKDQDAARLLPARRGRAG